MLISGLSESEQQKLIKIAPRLEGRIVPKGTEVKEEEDIETEVFPEQVEKAEKELAEKHQKKNKLQFDRQNSLRGEIEEFLKTGDTSQLKKMEDVSESKDE